MRFGLCVQSKIDEIGYVVHAENLGFDSAWFGDSPLVWSDPFACLALAAQQTRRMRLGTGVAVAGIRLPTTLAASIATVNRLAPGRTFLGLGSGNTGWRMLGHPQLPFREFESYLETVTRLLHGEEAQLTTRGRTSVVRLQMAHLGFVEVDPPVPVVVSAFGPRTLALTGRLGDGLVTAVPSPGRAAKVRAAVEAGAADAGRQVDGSFPVTAMGHVVVLEPGEDIGSERVRAAMGTTVLGSLHFAYENWRETGGGEPPGPWASIWDEYTAMVEAEPARTRHLRIHAGHSTYVHPDEWRFVTRNTIATAALVGEPAELLDRIAALEAAGVDELLLLPPLDLWYPEIERFARLVLDPYRG